MSSSRTSIAPASSTPSSQGSSEESSHALTKSTSKTDRKQNARHWKSRRGCFDCKRRKIKCQETLPSCANCLRLSLPCRYPSHIAAHLASSSASSSSLSLPNPPPIITIHSSPAFTLTDLRLFHHFLVAAHPHFPVRASSSTSSLWTAYLAPIAHDTPFLMHALLALAAAHLQKLSPGSGLGNVAEGHRLKAVAGVNERLQRRELGGSAEEADAVVGACYALLMQSWYMDDGMAMFVVLTRACEGVARQVRGMGVGARLVEEGAAGRVDGMRARLEGVPAFREEFLLEGVRSVELLRGLCVREYEVELWGLLRGCLLALGESPLKAYLAHLSIDTFLTSLDHAQVLQLISPASTTSQLLLAHLVALYLILRPIVCRERKQYTVTVFSIRMTRWIGCIGKNVGEGWDVYLEWPRRMNRKYVHGGLEGESLVKSEGG